MFKHEIYENDLFQFILCKKYKPINYNIVIN